MRNAIIPYSVFLGLFYADMIHCISLIKTREINQTVVFL